ncbi:septal ring lytic transglycosylase RlpA family protein [Sphingomonas sp.]|uniref:septal ring lytic transglycosylase RlpA family protein n=1 Tax=Sphingomonas sp. TaxID=28214 RepID=UPI0025F8980A|nr:septal ring lytic transglycosylase RlpA family protein [Sphingomonas sp.]
MLIPLLLTVSAAAQDADFEDESVAATQGEADIETEIAGGMASYYGRELAGNRTASGERFDPEEMTAAHRTLPFGTRVRVTDPTSGRSVIVRINDRGPFHKSRLIDLSQAAARELGMIRRGSAMVQITVLTDGDTAPAAVQIADNGR